MAIIQGGNAPIVLELLNFTSGNITDARAVLSKGGKEVKVWTLETMTINYNVVTLPLTQEETSLFASGLHAIEFKYQIDHDVYFSSQGAVMVDSRIDKTIFTEE